jgi:hypothetical protein
MKTIAAAGASSGLHQGLHILITGPIPTICVALWVSQMNLPVDGRPDPDGAALVGYEHQADRCAKRWGASVQDCCQSPSSARKQPSPTHIPQKCITSATKRTSTHLVFQMATPDFDISPRA